MLYGGGRWPSRLVDLCHRVSGELGEDTLYEHFRGAAKKSKVMLERLTTFVSSVCLNEDIAMCSNHAEILKIVGIGDSLTGTQSGNSVGQPDHQSIKKKSQHRRRTKKRAKRAKKRARTKKRKRTDL